MRHQWPIEKQPESSSGNRQLAELHHLLTLVQEIAGEIASSGDALSEIARISSAYAAAPPMEQRRFDEAAAETAVWVAVGMKALTGSHHPPRAAAKRLADELARAIKRLAKIVSS